MNWEILIAKADDAQAVKTMLDNTEDALDSGKVVIEHRIALFNAHLWVRVRLVSPVSNVSFPTRQEIVNFFHQTFNGVIHLQDRHPLWDGNPINVRMVVETKLVMQP